LIHERHLRYVAVTGRATDAFVHVYAVIEIDVVGQIVDARPLYGFARACALADRFKIGAVGPNLRVTVHADLSRGDSRRGGSFNRSVTIAAINSVIACVMLVAELKGLLALYESACIP